MHGTNERNLCDECSLRVKDLREGQVLHLILFCPSMSPSPMEILIFTKLQPVGSHCFHPLLPILEYLSKLMCLLRGH